MAMLFALALTADRLTSKSARAHIGDSIRRSLEHSSSKNFRNPSVFIEKIKPFSLRSILVSAVFSIYAFVIIIYIQFFLLGYDFSVVIEGVREEYINQFVLFLVFIIASNFVVDYLSFTQTLVLLRLINRSNSKKSLFVIFFTDLLASINIFTFAYALFLAFGVLYIANKQEVADFIISVDSSDVTDEVSEALETLNLADDSFTTQYTIRIYERAPENAGSSATAIFVSSDVLTLTDLRRGIEQALQGLFPSHNVSLDTETGQAAPEETSSWRAIDYEMAGTIDYWLNESENFRWWYSSAYLVTDDVQDNFFVVATLSPGFQPLDRLRNAGNRNFLNLSDPNYFATWCADEAAEHGTCGRKIEILSNDLGIFQQQISLSKEYGGSLPLYTFFFTSLALTVTIHLLYASILMLRYSSIIASKLSIPVGNVANLDEHPIAVATFPLILVATAIFYLVGA